MCMKVSVIQTSLFWESRDQNFKMFDHILKNLHDQDLIILPEMFTTGFTMNTNSSEQFSEQSRTLGWMKNWCSKLDCAMIGSIACNSENKHYNRLLFVKPNSTYSFYDKRHLFTFANEHKFYTRGENKLVEKYQGWNIFPLICYDLRFPVWSRNTLINNKPQCDLLVYVANWPEPRHQHWATLLQARAIENQSYVIGCNRIGEDDNGLKYSGDSCIISPRGEILWSLTNSEGVGQIELDFEDLVDYRMKFPALSDSDKFNYSEES